MTICEDCAVKYGLMPLDKICGVGQGTCPHCKNLREVKSEKHDYINPNEKRISAVEILLSLFDEQNASIAAKEKEERKAKSKAYKNEWNLNNREKIRADSAKWYAENIERAKARNAKWRSENLEKANASSTKWQAENPEKVKVINAKWKAANREKIKVTTAKWYAKNSEKAKAYSARTRLAKKARLAAEKEVK